MKHLHSIALLILFAVLPRAGWSQPPPLIAIWNLGPQLTVHPVAIVVAPDGDVFVANRAARNLERFTSEGVLQFAWPSGGRDAWSITGPQGIAVDSDDHVFVAEYVILNAPPQTGFQVFTTSGAYLANWGTYGWGTAPGVFQSPFGVALGPGKLVYVTDPELGRMQVFSNEGVFITQWPTPGYGVTVDAASNVFVAEDAGIRKYTSLGSELTHWGTSGTAPGEFNAPRGVAVDAGGNVYVADTRNCRVQVFTGNGEFITQWGTLGREAGQFDSPQGIAVDASGRVCVADSYNNRIQVFGPVPTQASVTT